MTTHKTKRFFRMATMPTVKFAPGEQVNFAGTVLPTKDGLPKPKDFFRPGWEAVVLRWLSSPVVWTLIVLIVSSLGIFRELL